MKILFITKHIPYQPNSGITVRINNLLACLGSMSDVACVFIVPEQSDNSTVLGKCQLNVTNYLIETKKELFSLTRYFFHLLELFFIPRKVKTALLSILETEKPDLVWLEFGYLCHFVPFLRKFGIPIVYGSHNSQFKLDFDIWKSHSNILYKLKMAPFILLYYIHERRFFTLPDLVLCISQLDLSYYNRFVPSRKLQVLPFLFDERKLATTELLKVAHPYVCIIGSLKYFQNFSAVIFILEKVWPTIQKKNDRLYLYVVGDLPYENSPEHRQLMSYLSCSNRVVLTGMVESVIPYVKGALVNVAPLTIGSGVRTKIIESVACRTPVVSTTIGAEGLPFIDGESICIVDTPDGIAEKILELVENGQKRLEISEKAYLVYDQLLSFNAGIEKLRTLLGNYCRSRG